ncbi:MAG: hypothetical protein JNK05_29555 [Myxococcales bacterium]|nr:hypothetical protein [Myxococcales bacterium]
MSTLSALLAREHAVPPHKLDEAIQRQVLNGGDLESNLLEVQALSEESLTRFRAKMVELAPASREELAHAEANALARLDRLQCESHRVLPLRIEDGVLVVAVVDPPAEAARAALETAAGLPLSLRATLAFRLSWALARHYGSELSPRLRRLADRLSSGASAGQIAAQTTNNEPAAPARSAGAVKVKTAVLSALSALSAAIEDNDDAPESTETDDARANAPVEIEPRTAREEVLRRIDAAQDRDAILGLVLDFAVERLRYVALFVVQGDVAEGLDARGDGLPATMVRRIAVPLDSPSSFRAVRERGAPVVGALADSGTDAVVRSDLGRDGARGIALVPIHIGGRVVLIVWADHGPEPLDLAALDEVVALCGHAANAFERIIRERKARKGGPALDATRVTVGAIARRVAEQRGVQSLRALAARPEGEAIEAAPTVEPPVVAAPPAPVVEAPAIDGAATDVAVVEASAPESPAPLAPTPPEARPEVAPEPRAVTSAPERVEPPAPVDDSAEVPFSTDSEGVRRVSRGPEVSGRFVHGGRVPVAVDVIGPLPAPGGSIPPPARDAAADEVNALKLVAEVVRTGALDDGAAERLVALGERSLDAVFRYFPGPTYHDRSEPRSRVPRAAEVGPLLRLVVMFRHAAAQSLTELLESVDPEQRYYATLCLGEVVHPLAIARLGARLFDSDAPTRRIALEALRAYRKLPEFERVLRTLRTTLTDAAIPVERRRLAAQALADLRDSEAIPALLSGLTDSDPSVRSLSHRALVVLARQDFREDTRSWRDWWESAAGRHRIEWLIEALVHDDSSIRHEAGEELKKLSGIFVGYYFNLPRRERERAQQQYREWWEREGRSRFVR